MIMTGFDWSWQAREGRTPVPPERWDKDHWNLLAYVESRVVDHHGQLCWDHLTLSYRHWPMLYAARNYLSRDTSYDAGERYPLRIKDETGQTVTLPGHCEGDGLMDLADAGLVEIEMPPADPGSDYFLAPDGQPLKLHDEDYPSPRAVTGLVEKQLMPWARVRLTDQGRAVANELRAHRAAGGAWSDFRPGVPADAGSRRGE